MKRQIVPGLVCGAVGGLLLFVFNSHAPDALAAVQSKFNPPLLARVLYGGITEELLLRWGLMSSFVWLFWRVVQKRLGSPRRAYVWLAIVLSAILFGAGHLPAVSALAGSLDTDLVVHVTGANAVFGVAFGWLYWRYGLESAMVAHAAAHLVNRAAAFG